MAPFREVVSATVVEPFFNGREERDGKAILAASLRRIDSRELVELPVCAL
jgi:hypothetical protein